MVGMTRQLAEHPRERFKKKSEEWSQKSMIKKFVQCSVKGKLQFLRWPSGDNEKLFTDGRSQGPVYRQTYAQIDAR